MSISTHAWSTKECPSLGGFFLVIFVGTHTLLITRTPFSCITAEPLRCTKYHYENTHTVFTQPVLLIEASSTVYGYMVRSTRTCTHIHTVDSLMVQSEICISLQDGSKHIRGHSEWQQANDTTTPSPSPPPSLPFNITTHVYRTCHLV